MEVEIVFHVCMCVPMHVHALIFFREETTLNFSCIITGRLCLLIIANYMLFLLQLCLADFKLYLVG